MLKRIHLVYSFCLCCSISEFLYHPGENAVVLKSTLGDVNYWSDVEPGDEVNLVTLILEEGRMESNKSEVDYFVDFVNKLEPHLPVKEMSDDDLKKFLPDTDPDSGKAEHPWNVIFYENLTLYRDYYRSYLNFITESPLNKKDFIDTIRAVDDVPKFVKENLGWEKASMLEEAMIFAIFQRKCGNNGFGNQACENFTELKCSKCKMIPFCSEKCLEIQWNIHHKHCCQTMVKRETIKTVRMIPQKIQIKLMQRTNCDDIVSLDTFCKELFRLILTVFMESLENTKLLQFALMTRNLSCDLELKDGKWEVNGNGKYAFTKSKLHTAVKDYKEPVIEMKTLNSQMNNVFGESNFLTRAIRVEKDLEQQVGRLIRMMERSKACGRS